MCNRVIMGMALLLLAGCAAGATTAVSPNYYDTYCVGISHQRVMDARANNIEPELEPRIFGDTYAACRKDHTRGLGLS